MPSGQLPKSLASSSLYDAWSLGGFRVVFQSSLFDGVAFDPFSFQDDGLASAEVLQTWIAR
jgi:hypothetical protein